MTTHIGRYRLLKRLALGGMAEIWLARQGGAEGFQKLVVIKRILPNLAENPEFVRMFLDEARLAAHLSHPNIAQIYDLGAEDGSYFIAMEYVHGENLRTVLRRSEQLGRKGLPPAIAARVIQSAADGLYHAHVATDVGGRPLNVVHRDISPQNILLGYDGQVKLVDFGIAKAATQAQETRTGVLKGKFAYMSPEQCQGEKLDGRSDLFSLGIVLWELVTGQRLFSRKSDMATFTAICNDPPPPPSSLGLEVPASLESVIVKSLEKAADDRYADGSEMAQALAFYLREVNPPVAQRQLAQHMEVLFGDRISAWRDVLQGDASAVDEKLIGGGSDLFQPGTPSTGSASTARPAPPAPTPTPAPPPPPPAVPAIEEARTRIARTPQAPPARPAPMPPQPAAAAPRRRSLVPVLSVAAVVVIVGGGGLAYHLATAKPNGGSTPVKTSALQPVHPAAPAAAPTPVVPKAHPTPAATPPVPVAPPTPTPAPATKLAAATPAHTPTPHEPAHPPTPPHHPSHTSARPGYLTFNAKPWCRVRIDGADKGTTPLARLELRAGSHRVQCTGPGGATQTIVVHIASGHVLRKVLSFAPGRIAFRVKPWGHVHLDGKDLGFTPLPAQSVSPGKHHVVVENPKLSARKSLDIDVASGRTKVVDLDLAH